MKGTAVLRLGSAVVAVVATLGSVVGAVTAGAAPGPLSVECGDTITTDAVLDADLTCTGVGLTIGASNVTVDLNDHVLSGTNSGFAVVATGVDGITIENGIIEGFLFAVDVNESSDVTVRNLEIGLPDTTPGFPPTGISLGGVTGGRVSGIQVSGGSGIGSVGVYVVASVQNVPSTDIDIEGNGFDAVTTGIEVAQSERIEIAQNSTLHAGAGIAVEDASNVTVTANTTNDGLTGLYVDSDEATSTGVLLETNTATGNSSAGIFVDEGPGSATLRSNQTDRNSTGIVVRAPATTLTANTANDNTQLGIDAVTGVVDGGGNTATGNGDTRQCVGVVCGSGVGEPGPNEPGPTGPPVTPVAPLTPPGVAPPAPVVHASPRFTG